jgi:hypothetical protein
LIFISCPTARYGPTTPFGLLYSINPAIIIIAVPFVMALTQGFDPLKQIKFGEALMRVFSTILFKLSDNRCCTRDAGRGHFTFLDHALSELLWRSAVQHHTFHRRKHLFPEDV